MKYKAIIWDCDGVLIDSEVLACGVARDLFAEHGVDIKLNDFIARFTGKSTQQMIDELGPKIDPFALIERQKAAFEKNLRPTNGIDRVLQAIKLPMAVASGSSLKRLEHSLSITGLLNYFNGHVYSAEMVKHGKPAPDVFLLAAEKLNVAPQDCLVIEDGIHGIEAAGKAGMDVVAYAGASHMTPALRQRLEKTAVLAIIHDLSDLLTLIGDSFVSMAVKRA